MNTNDIKQKYNQEIPGRYNFEYEYNRWFATPLLHSGFKMMQNTIQNQVLGDDLAVQNILELGPGAGTWTKMLKARFTQTNFDLVDISKEMLALARKALGDDRFVYFESDFLDWHSAKKYDLFFSARALEYFPHKSPVIAKIFSLLNHDKYGFIITKNPQYWRYQIVGRKIPDMHRQQIKPKDLKYILNKTGFTAIEFYPAVMTLPFFKSAVLNNFLFKLLGNFKLNIISQLFTEAYLVKFKKQ